MEIIKYNAAGVQVVTGDVAGVINIADLLDTKGQLLTFDGSDIYVLDVGADDKILRADTTAPGGFKWDVESTPPPSVMKHYRSKDGLLLKRIDNAKLFVGDGSIDVAGTLVDKSRQTILNMATAADWLDGSTHESSDMFVWVYIDNDGNIKLWHKPPFMTDYTSPIATMDINGSPGLNATSVTYDGATNAGNVLPGDIAVFYGNADADYSEARLRGSGAGTSRNQISTAYVENINTGTGVLTLTAGHNINLTNNDRIRIIPYGPIIYRQEGSTWWRLLGAMWNNGSSNLDENRMDDRTLFVPSSSYTINSTTFTNIDGTNLAVPVLSDGSDIAVKFSGSLSGNNANSYTIRFELLLDGIAVFGNTGFANHMPPSANGSLAAAWEQVLTRLIPGTHVITVQWNVSNTTLTGKIPVNETLAGVVYNQRVQFSFERK